MHSTLPAIIALPASPQDASPTKRRCSPAAIWLCQVLPQRHLGVAVYSEHASNRKACVRMAQLLTDWSGFIEARWNKASNGADFDEDMIALVMSYKDAIDYMHKRVRGHRAVRPYAIHLGEVKFTMERKGSK